MQTNLHSPLPSGVRTMVSSIIFMPVRVLRMAVPRLLMRLCSRHRPVEDLDRDCMQTSITYTVKPIFVVQNGDAIAL